MLRLVINDPSIIPFEGQPVRHKSKIRVKGKFLRSNVLSFNLLCSVGRTFYNIIIRIRIRRVCGVLRLV